MSAGDQPHLALDDHDRPPRVGEREVGRTDPAQEITATIVVRRERVDESLETNLTKVSDFATAQRLRVLEISKQARSVGVAATAADFEKAFHVELMDVEHEGNSYRRFANLPSLPPELRDLVVGIFGLRGRPIRSRPRVHHANSTEPFWTARDLARAYHFPQEADGTGQVIALLEFGGGFDAADLDAFFAAQGVATPRITVKSIGGAQNQPCDASAVQQFLDVIEGKRDQSACDPAVLEAAQSTIEVTLDVQLAGALAPGAELVVYMAPATEDGIFQAMSAAIHDENPRVDVITMSWGEPEPAVSIAQSNAITQLLEDAVARGITVCASSGDFGAFDDPQSKQVCVNFPASSPLVLACGGTTVERSEETIAEEKAWNCGVHGMTAATGGGVSARFPRPEWQKTDAAPAAPNGLVGRGVPDVAAVADPHNGCEILVKGIRCSAFGTSAVAPLWAALIARYNQALGMRLGHLQPTLYQLALLESSPFRAIAEGDNGYYRAAAGWNACTGLGTPHGKQLLEALRSSKT